MAISIEPVQATHFAGQASQILHEAWLPPALSYSPEYLRWQLCFPTTLPLPAFAAFDGNEPVGFAGVTARRLRAGPVQRNAGIVSFVAVRPQWWRQGIAAGLYAKLLGVLQQLALPVVTFAVDDSQGQRALLCAYPEAGFRVRPLGSYPICSYMLRVETPGSSWQAEESRNFALLARIVNECASDEGLIWNDPSDAQICHYQQDPRPRRLIVLRHRETGQTGAAWVTQCQFRATHQAETVTQVEGIFLPRKHGDALTTLFRHAATIWPAPNQAPVVVTSPSLYGFDPACLLRAGIRRTGALIRGYLCTPDGNVAFERAHGTNLEVV